MKKYYRTKLHRSKGGEIYDDMEISCVFFFNVIFWDIGSSVFFSFFFFNEMYFGYDNMDN